MAALFQFSKEPDPPFYAPPGSVFSSDKLADCAAR